MKNDEILHVDANMKLSSYLDENSIIFNVVIEFLAEKEIWFDADLRSKSNFRM